MWEAGSWPMSGVKGSLSVDLNTELKSEEFIQASSQEVCSRGNMDKELEEGKNSRYQGKVLLNLNILFAISA
jgi:hypothetical protein